jgi:hypothetical protein
MGGLIYECTLHENLIQHKKTLAVEKYCDLALRLTTPGCFPFFLLHETPVAFAGECGLKDGTLKSSKLQGPVVIAPAITINTMLNDYEESLKSICRIVLPNTMRAVIDQLSKGDDVIDDAYPVTLLTDPQLKFYEETAWVCEIKYTT